MSIIVLIEILFQNKLESSSAHKKFYNFQFIIHFFSKWQPFHFDEFFYLILFLDSLIQYVNECLYDGIAF